MPLLPCPLILASGSPRRRQLLDEAGYEFTVVVPDPSAECGMCSQETPPELVARLAYQKAADVVPRVCGPALVVACDTLVALQGRVFGKPEDEAHAREILRSLRGREHQVYSGLCVWPVPSGEPRIRVEQSQLRMQDLPDSTLEEYLTTGLWEGKAGAFGYQDRRGWIELLQGSESNVVGLPMELLAQMLSEWQAGLNSGNS